jgi:hypothetical protein
LKLRRNLKYTSAAPLVLLAALLLLGTLCQSFNFANAQVDQSAAIVVVAPSTGGSTNPSAGTYSYPNNTAFTLSAIPDFGYEFQSWVISGDFTPGHNITLPTYTDPDTGAIITFVPPYPTPVTPSIDALVLNQDQITITCGYGYTYQYQAIFVPIPAPSTPPGSAESVVLYTAGGTTTPPPGSYTYAAGQQITFSAVPNAGYRFQYWVISGTYTPGTTGDNVTLPTFTDPDTGTTISNIATYPSPFQLDTLVVMKNPFTVTCGFGYTYNYQAVFAQVNVTTSPGPLTTPIASSSPAPTATLPASSSSAQVTSTPTGNNGGLSTTVIAAIIVVVIVIIIVAVLAVMMRRKK